MTSEAVDPRFKVIQYNVLKYIHDKLEKQCIQMDLINKKINEVRYKMFDLYNDNMLEDTASELDSIIQGMKDAQQKSCNVAYTSKKTFEDSQLCCKKVEQFVDKLSKYSE